MIWDGFQWHPAPTQKQAADYRASKFPPHLLNNNKFCEESTSLSILSSVNSANVQQAAALAACGTKLNTKYPPNPMNACPLVNPDIAAACAAAAAVAGKLTPQQATILKLASVNKTAYYNTNTNNNNHNTNNNDIDNDKNNDKDKISTIMAASNAVHQQMNKFFPQLMNKQSDN